MNAAFEKKAREKGLAVPSKYLENRMRVNGVGGNVFDNQGNSLLEIRNSTEDLVADAVCEIGENHEDILDTIRAHDKRHSRSHQRDPVLRTIYRSDPVSSDTDA